MAMIVGWSPIALLYQDLIEVVKADACELGKTLAALCPRSKVFLLKLGVKIERHWNDSQIAFKAWMKGCVSSVSMKLRGSDVHVGVYLDTVDTFLWIFTYMLWCVSCKHMSMCNRFLCLIAFVVFQERVRKLELMGEYVCPRWHRDMYCGRGIISYNLAGTQYLAEVSWSLEFYDLTSCYPWENRLFWDEAGSVGHGRDPHIAA